MKDERFEKLFAERAAIEPEDVAAMWDGSTYKSPGYNVEFAEMAAIEPEDVAAIWDGSTYKSPGYNVELAWDFWCAGSKSVPICDCYGSMFKE